jgi:hypothetical protein
MSAVTDQAAGREVSVPQGGLSVLGFASGDRAFAPAGAGETTLDAAAASGSPVVALYRAPWTAYLEDQDSEGKEAALQWLADWIRFHRGVLDLQRQFPARVLLVNVAGMGDGGPLLAHLRELGLRCGGEHAEASPGGTRATGLAGPEHALQSLLAAGMADACPDAWTVYEELESRALLLGREPEFRGADAVADLSNPGELLAGFAALRDAIEQELKAGRLASTAVDSTADTLRKENELLGLHLEQVLEELQFHSEDGKRLRRRLQEAGRVSEGARMLISRLWATGNAPG